MRHFPTNPLPSESLASSIEAISSTTASVTKVQSANLIPSLDVPEVEHLRRFMTSTRSWDTLLL